MGLNYHNLRLVDIINNGVPQETLVKTTAKGERDVLALIAKDFPTDHVTNIKTVKNSFLEALFLLKKEEMKSRYGQVQELLLIHVTGAAAVESICSNNFDWRRVRRGKFGIGNSFSPDAEYANRYANYDIGHKRAFIITRVLVSSHIQGCQNQKFPQKTFDTTTGRGLKVYVKYWDNDTMPQYVAYYDYEPKTVQPPYSWKVKNGVGIDEEATYYTEYEQSEYDNDRFEYNESENEYNEEYDESYYEDDNEEYNESENEYNEEYDESYYEDDNEEYNESENEDDNEEYDESDNQDDNEDYVELENEDNNDESVHENENEEYEESENEDDNKDDESVNEDGNEGYDESENEDDNEEYDESENEDDNEVYGESYNQDDNEEYVELEYEEDNEEYDESENYYNNGEYYAYNNEEYDESDNYYNNDEYYEDDNEEYDESENYSNNGEHYDYEYYYDN